MTRTTALVSGCQATVHEKRYDLVINDTAVTAVYPLEDVRPLAQTEYNLTCNINR